MHAENYNVNRLRSNEPDAACNCGLECPVSAQEVLEIADRLDNRGEGFDLDNADEDRAKLRALAEFIQAGQRE